MTKTSLIATALTLALAGAPVVTVASAAPYPDPIAHAATQHDSSYHGPVGQHGTAGAPRAYGKACAGESRKHVKGQKGTPFSQCVHALKTLDNGTATSPKAACKAESHKHIKGEKGTPFSRCVAAAHKAAHTHPHAAAVAGPR